MLILLILFGESNSEKLFHIVLNGNPIHGFFTVSINWKPSGVKLNLLPSASLSLPLPVFLAISSPAKAFITTKA